MHAEYMTLWWQVVQPFTIGIHEPKWKSHVKRPSDVALRYTSSGLPSTSYYVLYANDISGAQALLLNFLPGPFRIRVRRTK